MGRVTHRTDFVAASLRPAVRVLAVALFVLAAVTSGAFPAHAEQAAAPPPVVPFTGPIACPYHVSSPHEPQGGSGGCGSEVRVCQVSTVPPLPPVVDAPDGSFVPPWLVDPDASGSALAAAPSAVSRDLHDLCVSRT